MKKHIFAAMLAVCVLALNVVGQPAASSIAPERHKVQINDRALGRQLMAGGARVVADYGGYILLDAPSSLINFPATKAELRDEYNVIHLNAARLDTTAPEVKALRKTAGNFAGKRLHLIQFAGPVQPQWRKDLLDSDVQIVSYIPQNAYLVYGDAGSVARVQAMAALAPHVQWEGAFADEYKIHPLANPAAAKSDLFAIQLLFDNAANGDTLKLIDQLKLAPIARQRHVLNYVNVVARVAPANLAQIAARPDVISIQPYATPRKLCERQDQIVAGNLSGSAPIGPGYLAWLQSKGFNSSQFTSFAVDVTDSGIDNGTTSPNHFGLYANGVIASGNSRVIYNRLEGLPNPGSTLEGCDGHGNINSHIVGGFDNRSTLNVFADSSGYHYGLGVCPFALVGSSVIFDPTNFTEPVYENLISEAYHDGARISNNSWGDSDPSLESLYNLDSQEYDALVRDAQPAGSTYPAGGNQEMVIVFAAGNDGQNGSGSVSPPSTGKNVICVGAADNDQPFGGANGGADLGDTTDSQADNANKIVDFSAQGPCSDGRQKPDLVAPGTHISGGAPQAANPGTTGTALACFKDNSTSTIGVDGGPNGSYFFPTTGQQFYTASSGTSHSTPCVAGGCALVRQYFINQGWTPPSPAMTKAFLMNSTRYLTGTGAGGTLWSPTQGMGEMNLGTAFDGLGRLMRDEQPGDMFTASGQTRVFTGVIADSTKPFRVTLAWTDAPGSTSGDAYNNDLDLTVTIGGQSFKGNNFSGPYSTTTGSADQKNNVESVFLPQGYAGSFTVTVTAANINSVGVPGAAGEVNQDFALVVYNSGAAPAMVAAGSALTLETCLPTNGVIDPGESVGVNLSLQNIGSASTTNLVATLLFTNGVAFPSSPQNYGAIPPGAAGTAAFTFEADGNCGDVITATLQLQDGTASVGAVSYNFQLGRIVTTTNFSQNFDAVAAPALPDGWSTSDLNDGAAWSTESGVSVSGSNAAFCPDSDFIDEVFLTSPGITLPGGPSQLTFQHKFNLEDAYDGGVLQISVNGSEFQDILAAGGKFVTGGYIEPLISAGDPASQWSPLYNQSAWSGASDGFMTTIVNLPAASQGQTIQLQWACGTDAYNDSLVGVGGWWIDNIVITQTNASCCTSTPSSVPVILLPANNSSTSAATIEILGTASTNVTLTLFDNGTTSGILTADATGIFSESIELAPGTNVLFVEVNGTTNASATVTVVILPPAPTLDVSSVSQPTVAVSGTGEAGAVVTVLTNGVPAATFTVDSSDNYAGTITVPVGSYVFSATETTNGLTSAASAATSVTVSVVPAPVIVFPPNGRVTNNGSMTITGTGISGAPVQVFDGATLLGATTVSFLGKFSLAVKLANGVHLLTAIETSNDVSSAASPTTSVIVDLIPVITASPQSLKGFPKETVKFTASAYGSTPLRYIWQKNGVNIPGAAATLTLNSLTSTSGGNYQMIAANSFGSATTAVATLTIVTNPFANLTGNYYGLFPLASELSNAQFASSGFVKLTLGSLGTFSGSILNAGGTYPFTGGFSIDGQADVSVSRGSRLTPLMVNMNLDLTTNDTEQITGTVSNASWTAGLQADRATFATTNPFPWHGSYTMAFENTNDGSTSPGGDGYGRLSISTAGMVTWSGSLADGTSVVPAAVSVSKFGQWPLYVPLYGTLGSLSGWISVTNGAIFSGEANWFRAGAYGKLYKSGFANSLSIVGSSFMPGTTKIPALSSTNLVLTLSGGGLGEILTNGLRLFDTGRFVTNVGDVSKLTLSLVPSTGIITGSFLDPQTRLTTAFKGVVLQRQDVADGYFISTNATGTVTLTPENP